MTVVYDGNKSITGNNVFEVLDTTSTTVPTTTTTIPTISTSCGDIWPPPSSPEAMDCGDGVLDEKDLQEYEDIIYSLSLSTTCQLMKGDLPNGIPPYCGNPAGSDNCETDGDLDVFDLIVIYDIMAGKSNCCSYCEFGEIF